MEAEAVVAEVHHQPVEAEDGGGERDARPRDQVERGHPLRGGLVPARPHTLLPAGLQVGRLRAVQPRHLPQQLRGLRVPADGEQPARGLWREGVEQQREQDCNVEGEVTAAAVSGVSLGAATARCRVRQSRMK